MELYKANRQWAERPADERFWTLGEMAEKCAEYRASASEATVKFSEMRVEARGGEICVVGKKNIPARLTHWSFGQVCARAGAPAGYLRGLPATLAAQNLNHGLADSTDEEVAKLLFHKNGDFVMRAATGPGYSRIWNGDLVRRLDENLPAGWRAPPARPAGVENESTRKATKADVLDLSTANAGRTGGATIKEGDLIAPAGLYASDHDMFAFMVNENQGVNDGAGHHLGRGFFLWNSEVGAASFGIVTFLYDAICGNHIVWGAKGVQELRIRHVGEADGKAFRGIRAELIRYADESVSDVEAKIKAARRYEFGGTREEAIEKAFSILSFKHVHTGRKTIGQAYDVAEERGRYGSPRSAWGLVNGLTELSQNTPHMDERVKLDRAAGKLMEIEF